MPDPETAIAGATSRPSGWLGTARRSPKGRWTIVAAVTLAAFTDILAYSIAVPVLPDLGRKFGASPTVLGLLFASFGVTLLGVSIPMGAISDRIGRKRPLLGGLAALIVASIVFAFADRLSALFAARLVQGAADAITWVVGLALIAEAYPPAERGRMNGVVMSGASLGFMVGPTLGGWLYEAGGLPLPFLTVAAFAALALIICAFVDVPGGVRLQADGACDVGSVRLQPDPVSFMTIIRVPAVADCVFGTILAGATLSMLEPVIALHLQALGANPGRIGTLFGVAALTTIALHPWFGHLADRHGARRMMVLGLFLAACVMPVFGLTWSFRSALVLYTLQIAAAAMAVAPSLSYMAHATSEAGVESFGISYGVYNVAWGVGLLVGPSLGGLLFDRLGLSGLTLAWAPAMLVATTALARNGAVRRTSRAL